MRKKFSLLALTAVSALALSACGGGSDDASSSAAPLDPAHPVTVKVAATAVPQAQILEYVNENLTEGTGITLDVTEMDDYVIPNQALNDGEVDANYFQHLPYLEDEMKNKGYKFEHGAGIHLEPVSLYSKNFKDASEIGDGATIAITNDASNQLRGLKLLQQAGLLKGIEDTDTALDLSGDANPEKNPKKLKLEEMNPEVVVQQIDDPKVAAAVVNGNFVLGAKLTLKPIVVESTQDNPYANLLVWREGHETPAIDELEALLHSDEVKSYIEKTWPDQNVVPAF